jgi:hypothetical protein
MTTKPPLQKILKGTLHTEDEEKHNHAGTGSNKPHEKNRQVFSSINSANTQILKQQKQLNGRNHIHLNVNIEY